MKHYLLYVAAALMLCCPLAAQTTESGDEDADFEVPERHPVTLPGAGHICVEDLRAFPLDMSLDGLSLAELRVLRNAIAARQGYAFESKDLRSLFSSTSWYDSLMYTRYERVEESFNEHPVDWEALGDEDYRVTYARQHDRYVPLQYTAAEQRFVERVKAREKLLREKGKEKREKYNALPGNAAPIVDIDEILNPWQLDPFPDSLRTALTRNGFAIVPADHVQLFHVYEQNDYTVFPSFVTTDVYLQLFHFYFDCVLRDIEVQKLDSAAAVLCRRLTDGVRAVTSRPVARPTADAAAWLEAYLAVATALQTGTVPPVREEYAAEVAAEVARCEGAENALSPFLGYTQAEFPYSLFRPRGHYAADVRLQRYFRMMMWLQTASFATDNPEQMRRAVLLADVLASDTATAATYRRLTEPMTFLLGAPDNVSLMQVAELMRATHLPTEAFLTTEKHLSRLTADVEALAERQTRIRPKNLVTARHKLNLMPQRYMPDAEILQEMADTETLPTTLRKMPRALDVMAAMGSSAAERILIDELHEADRWPEFPLRLDSMRRRMAAIDWNETVATMWMRSLTPGPSPVGEGSSHHLTAQEGVESKDGSESSQVSTPLSFRRGVGGEAGEAVGGEAFPPFMLTPAWQKKSLNTALASYAELKHDAILYAKQPFGAECGGGGPPEPVIKGYVEPSIAFWQKAVELNGRMEEVLTRFGLMTEKAASASSAIADLAEFLLEMSRKELEGKPLTAAENDQIEIIGSTIEYISLDLARGSEQFLSSWDDVQGADRNVACIADVYTANAFNIPSGQKAILYEAVGPASEIYVVVEIQGQLWLTRGAVFSYRELERPIDMPRLTDEEWQQWLQQHPDDGTPEWMHDIIVPLHRKPQPNAEIFYSSGC